jgi:hypothetical protein
MALHISGPVTMSWQAKLATVLVGNLYRVVLSRLHEESSFKKCARYSRLYPSRHLSEACGNTTREGSFLPPAITPRGVPSFNTCLELV